MNENMMEYGLISIVSPGGVEHHFMTDTLEACKAYAEENNWEFIDHNEFSWDLEITPVKAIMKEIGGESCTCFEFLEDSRLMRMKLDGTFGDDINRTESVLVPMFLDEAALEEISDLWLNEQEKELGLPVGESCSSNAWWVGAPRYAGEKYNITHKYDGLIQKVSNEFGLAHRKFLYRWARDSKFYFDEPGRSSKSTEHYTISIYQLKPDQNLDVLREKNLNHILKQGFTIDGANYEKVYEGQMRPYKDKEAALNALWYKFIGDPPAEFSGHPFGWSDVIVLNENGKLSAHYYNNPITFDPIFPEVPEFLKTLPDKEFSSLSDQIRDAASKIAVHDNHTAEVSKEDRSI